MRNGIKSFYGSFFQNADFKKELESADLDEISETSDYAPESFGSDFSDEDIKPDVKGRPTKKRGKKMVGEKSAKRRKETEQERDDGNDEEFHNRIRSFY